MTRRFKILFIIWLVLAAPCLTVPLGAQLQEAIKVPWPGFQVLEGRWQERNGRGVMHITKISSTGGVDLQFIDLEAVYVSQAQAARDGKSTKILISLRYPNALCCIYDLTYDPHSDQLRGVFWRKGSIKTTGVVFDRLRPKFD